MTKPIEKYKVLLINPPYPGKTADPSPSLGYLGSMIRDCGASVYIWDREALYSYKEKFNQVMDLIRSLGPDFIGLTLTTPFVRYGYKLANSIKNEFNTPLVAGGTHTTLCPEEVLKKSAFEIAVIGEGEHTIVDLIKYFKGEIKLKDIQGLAYKDMQGNIKFTEPRSLIHNLDELPFPLEAQSILHDNKGGIFGQILTSRGCPARCIFCGSLVHGKQYRFRTAENVFAEMEFLYLKHGINRYRFQDDALTINQNRLKQLCDLMIDKKFRQFSWTCQTRADALDIDLLKKMKEAGCSMIDIGLETASESVMKKIKKNTSIAKALETIDNCNQIRLPVTLNMMSGFPFETREDIKCNLDFARTVAKKIDRFNVGLVLRPYPGTEVYNIYHHDYGFSQWWLKDRFTLSEDTDYVPLYLSERLGAWTLPEDPILERDFFSYSDDIKKEIRKFVRYKCWFSMKKCHGIVRTFILLTLFYASKYLSRIKPAADKILILPLFRLGQKTNYLLELLSRKSKQLYLSCMDMAKRIAKLIRRVALSFFLRPDKIFRYLVNRILFIFCLPSKGLAGWPVAFYIGINNKCNLKCKSCDVGQRQINTYIYKNMVLKDELKPDEWKTIINKIAYLKPYIEISAIEPLLYKDILEIVEFIKSDKRLNLSLTTNGFLLEKFADDLVRLNVDRIDVSIDGPKEIHDQIRGVKGSFDAAARGIKRLLSYKNHPRLGINYTVSSYNYTYLLETIDYLSGLFQWNFFTFIHLSFVTDEIAKIQNERFVEYPATAIDISGINLNGIDTTVLITQIKKIKQKYKNRNVVFHPNISLKKIKTYYKNPFAFTLKKQCIMPWISASILCNGDVMAFNRCPTPSFGNLLTSEFKSIWNNQEFRKFRMRLKRVGAFPVCSRCGCLKMK